MSREHGQTATCYQLQTKKNIMTAYMFIAILNIVGYMLQWTLGIWARNDRLWQDSMAYLDMKETLLLVILLWLYSPHRYTREYCVAVLDALLCMEERNRDERNEQLMRLVPFERV